MYGGYYMPYVSSSFSTGGSACRPIRVPILVFIDWEIVPWLQQCFSLMAASAFQSGPFQTLLCECWIANLVKSMENPPYHSEESALGS